jgi:hypothetical protein
MTRTRWTAAATVGLAALLFGAPTQAVAQQGAERAAPQQAAGKIVPVSADEQVDRTVVDAKGQARTEQESNRFYRDGKGRIRQEKGSLVTITDPASTTILKLNTQTRTYQKVTANKPAANATQPKQSAQQKPQISPMRSLGTAQMSGVSSRGMAYTITSPRPSAKPVTKEITVWASGEVQLNTKTQVTDSTGARYALTYSNIKTGQPNANLFTVPTGYREGSVTPSSAEQTPCPLLNAPDPLILFDLGAGLVEAVTDIQQGCIFIAHAWAFVFPLEIWPALNPELPGIPYDAFIAFDDGFFSPCGGFLPCAVPGDITFFAANTTDLTIKDSAVILTRFFLP